MVQPKIYFRCKDERYEITNKKVLVKTITPGDKGLMVTPGKDVLIPGILISTVFNTIQSAYAANTKGVDQMREGFEQLMGVFTAIAEPILWGYAVAGFVLMATSSKERGWQRIKTVGYAYMGIVLLPTFFAFLRYIAGMFKQALTIGG